jgi:hypothetical protein
VKCALVSRCAEREPAPATESTLAVIEAERNKVIFIFFEFSDDRQLTASAGSVLGQG